MKATHVLRIALLALVTSPEGQGQQAPALDFDQFDRLHALIQPQPGESPWRQIDWLTDVTEARLRAVRENKPVLIFTAADGSPLGRT